MADFDPDDSFAEMLAQYDALLATGQTDMLTDTLLPEDGDHPIRQRLDEAKDCLHLLEGLWPRAQGDAMDSPKSVGRFRIVEELGRGGFGVVYLANDDKLSRLVALKVQRPEAVVSPQLRARFVAEARSAGRLQHANIATIYEVGEAGVRIWLSTEYCNGGSLAQWLAASHATPTGQSVAAFTSTLADAIEYSHQQGVLHRDLKPSNVLLQRTTEPGTSKVDSLTQYVPKLIDFGLAKNEDEASQHTRTGALLGTPAYMAPEQANGRHDLIGPPTDVYGIGLILYELLTGRPAFVGESDLAVLTKVSDGDFVQPRVIRRELSRDLEAICLKCLQTKPSDRYASAGDLAADLRRFMLGKQTLARPLTIDQRVFNWSRRRPAVAALLSVSVLGSLLLVAMTSLYVSRLQEAQAATESARLLAEQNASAAQQQEAIAERFLYSSRIALAFQDLDQGNAADAAARLMPYADKSSLSRLRGFEWHYLWRQIHDDSLVLRGHEGEVYAVLISPDDRHVVSGSQDGTIRFWDKQTGKQRSQIQAHAKCVNSLSYSANGKLLASGGCDGMVHVWDAASHQLLTTLRDHPPVVQCVTFSPTTDDRLATCGNDPLVRIWDVQSGLLAQSFDTHGLSAKALRWSQDGQALYVLASDNWTYAPNNVISTWKPNEDLVESLPIKAQCFALSPNDNDLLVGLLDSTIRHIKTNDVNPRILSGHQRQVEALAFSSDGTWLASSSEDARVRLWDVGKGGYLRTLSGHTGRVQALAFDRHATSLATASYDKTVRVWDLAAASQQMHSLTLKAQLPVPPVHRLAISGDLRRLAVLTSDKQLEVRDLSSFELLASADVGPLSQPEFVQGYNLVAKSLRGGSKRYLWTENLESVVESPLPSPEETDELGANVWAVSNEGSLALVEHSPRQSSFELIDRKSGRQTAILTHRATVLKIVFSPDSQTIASGCADGTVRLWNVATGQEIAHLATHSGAVVAVQFSSDSRALAAIVEDPSVHQQDPSIQAVRIFVWSGRREEKQ